MMIMTVPGCIHVSFGRIRCMLAVVFLLPPMFCTMSYCLKVFVLVLVVPLSKSLSTMVHYTDSNHGSNHAKTSLFS